MPAAPPCLPRHAPISPCSREEEKGIPGLVLIPDLEMEIGFLSAIGFAEKCNPVPLFDLGLFADGSDPQMCIDRCIIIIVLDDDCLSVVLEERREYHRSACRRLNGGSLAGGDPDTVDGEL